MQFFKLIYTKFELFFRLINPLINLRIIINSIFNYPSFIYQYFKFKNKSSSNNISIKDLYPCLNDNTEFTSFDRHYIYHPAWAARILAETKPDVHYDISSTLNFSSLLSAFIPTKFYDFRPAKLILSNFTSEHVDLLNLSFDSNSINSLSCMHTIEHIGLGRYGDLLDPAGDKKAIDELKRVIAPGGNLLFVVPVGKPKIMFNAHRIYSYDQIINFFAELVLMNFSLVPDDKNLGFIENADRQTADKQKYGCGCFWFRKKAI